MGLLRRKGFLAAVAVTSVLALYFALVAGRAMVFIQDGDSSARAIGVALLVLPAIGVWWLIHEWRLGTTVQRMADRLEEEGRLPIHDGETDEFGRLTEDSQEAIFETAKLWVDEQPESWSAWFHVAYAYEASGDRRMARSSLRHAADLFRAESNA